jgi:hypothetical protein
METRNASSWHSNIPVCAFSSSGAFYAVLMVVIHSLSGKITLDKMASKRCNRGFFFRGMKS